jgi:uncharacterized lipoprotein YmbA
MKMPESVRLAPWARRAAWPLPAAMAAWLLAACASTGSAPQLYQLRAMPPAPASAPAAQASGPVVQLLMPVTLPEALERDTIVVEQGQAGLQALAGHRWAEPLRDAVPRVLRQDLALLLGPGHVLVAPLPAGAAVQRQLRVDVLHLQANAARSQVQMQVRWVLSAPGSVGLPAGAAASAAPAVAAPTTRLQTFSAPVNGADVDAIVAAHRMVLWRLAEAVADQVKAQAPR